MESESGAKIAIRGKGSVKEGKGKSDAAHASNQDEDLHCLIMADTEEKVNKAKKLIHQVIETVRANPLNCPLKILTVSRLPPPQRHRTNSSVTSFVNLQRSTVLCVTTRTKLVRIAARSATASTTARTSRTLSPTSFAVSVATLATWLATAQTASAVPAGATCHSAASTTLKATTWSVS